MSPEAFSFTQIPASAEESDALRAVPVEGGRAAVIDEAGIFLGASRPAAYPKRADAESAQRDGGHVGFVSGQHARASLTSPKAEEATVVCTSPLAGMWIKVDDGEQLSRGVRSLCPRSAPLSDTPITHILLSPRQASLGPSAGPIAYRARHRGV